MRERTRASTSWFRFAPLVFKQVWRHRTRSLLTVLGVATAMFLFCAVEGMQRGVAAATHATSADNTLVVYRENRFCPFSSNLPQFYEGRIKEIPGVASVVPMRIVVNNCRASLDVITYRGVPADAMGGLAEKWEFTAGGVAGWGSRSDAAIVGEHLAKRRGFRVGDSFDAAGITVYVAGIVRSDAAQDQNVAYVHLDFLQRATKRNYEGIVTQFNVKVTDPARLDEVATAIDAAFATDPEPTSTRSEKAFVARAASDIVELVGYSRWLGWGCLVAVGALVGNAIVLSVQDRIRDHAVMQTLGYPSSLIAALIVAEGVLMGIAGGALGSAAALGAMRFGRFSLSVEGLSMNVTAGWGTVVLGLLGAGLIGVVAGLVPAMRAGRTEIAACFRVV
jgi:putative ABC transport system permease protein